MPIEPGLEKVSMREALLSGDGGEIAVRTIAAAGGVATSGTIVSDGKGGDSQQVTVVDPGFVGAETVGFESTVLNNGQEEDIWGYGPGPGTDILAPTLAANAAVVELESDDAGDVSAGVLIRGIGEQSPGGLYEITTEIISLTAGGAGAVGTSTKKFLAPLFNMEFLANQNNPVAVPGDKADANAVLQGNLSATIGGANAIRIAQGDMSARSSARIVPPGEEWTFASGLVSSTAELKKASEVELWILSPPAAPGLPTPVPRRALRLYVSSEAITPVDVQAGTYREGTLMYLRARSNDAGTHVTGSICWMRRAVAA